MLIATKGLTPDVRHFINIKGLKFFDERFRRFEKGVFL